MKNPANPGIGPGRARRWIAWCAGALLGAYLLAPIAVMAGGGKPATRLVNVADTRALEPGISKFIADVYNTNLILFGLLVLVTMAGMGALLGFACDKIVGLIGIDLGKLSHHE